MIRILRKLRSKPLALSDADGHFPMKIPNMTHGGQTNSGVCYLVGNFVVMEFADSLEAADTYMFMQEVNE